jgi:hypothetical protein
MRSTKGREKRQVKAAGKKEVKKTGKNTEFKGVSE